jgi:predicted Zn-dependent protease
MRNKPQIAIGIVIALVAAFSYYSRTETNSVTGDKQHITLSPEQEIVLGLNAAPEMEKQFGGEIESAELAGYIESVGQRVVARSEAAKTPYKYKFHGLRDAETVNAFALPGGQIFITMGLLKRLTNEAELAGCLGHEIGHVVGRHGAEHIAKQQFAQGLVGAAGVAAYDDRNPRRSAEVAAMAAAVSHLVNLKYGRSDELEADALGVQFMKQAGYDPRGMLDLMEVLAQLGKGSRQPEFFSTHPNPENRLERIQKLIAEGGPPSGETGEARFQKHVPGIRR